MKFKNNGTGEKDLDYTVMDITRAEHVPLNGHGTMVNMFR